MDGRNLRASGFPRCRLRLSERAKEHIPKREFAGGRRWFCAAAVERSKGNWLSRMKFLAACVVSSVLGGLFVCGWSILPAATGVGPGERFPRTDRASRCPTIASLQSRPSSPMPAGAAELIFNSEGLSPEEAIGVAVYDHDQQGGRQHHHQEHQHGDDGRRRVVGRLGLRLGARPEGHILTNYHVIEDAQEDRRDALRRQKLRS